MYKVATLTTTVPSSKETPKPTKGRCSRNFPLSRGETNLYQLYEKEESTTSREVVTITTLIQGNREELLLSYQETNTYNDLNEFYGEEATTRRGLVKRRKLLSRQQPTSNIEINTPKDSDHRNSCGNSLLEERQELHSNETSPNEVSEENSMRGLQKLFRSKGSSNIAMTLHVLSADGEQQDGSNLLLDDGRLNDDNSKPDTAQIIEYHDDDNHNRLNLHASDCHLPQKTPHKLYFDTDPHHGGTGMIEIWPDIFVPLKDQGETSCAIISGRCTLVTCLCCCLLVECCDDVLYVLCPQCNVVNPIVSFSTPISFWRKHCACLWGSRKYKDDIYKGGKKAAVCVGIAQNSYDPLWSL